MKEITKELLSEILGEDLVEFDDGGYLYRHKEKQSEYVASTKEAPIFINLYELMHKAKEWARVKGILLTISYTQSGVTCGYGYDYTNVPKVEYFAETEPEAVFKACQFILENKGE